MKLSDYTIVKDDKLVKKAASSAEGRQFWTGGALEDALVHLASHPMDVCMARLSDDNKATSSAKIVLLGGPIPPKTLVDVTNESFLDIADSFDVGQMTSLVQAWFQKDFNKQVTVHILESGEMITVGSANTKLISLSRQTPALLDMAATENGASIGQYSTKGTLGHSGDCHSIIGDVNCLHHELPMCPSAAGGVKLYFLVGYSSKPLKAWRDSRVFWIVYDADQETCWLVPHDLSHKAVGDKVSATMPLVSRSNLDKGENTISVMHLSSPVQASLAAASPLNTGNQSHRQYLAQCTDQARAIHWEGSAASLKMQKNIATAREDKAELSAKAAAETKPGDDAPSTRSIDRAIAVFDGCNDVLLDKFPQIQINGKGGEVVSPMHGPLKVLARGCCANSRVVLLNGSTTCASSEVNSVTAQLSGMILVKMTETPDIYKLHQIRWNMARAPRTPVLAITPDGCKHLCGPMPPSFTDEENPTPVAGTPICNEAVMQLVEFALSDEGDEYFGSLYQTVPNYEQTKQAIADFIADMDTKDFSVINDAEPEETNDSFTDNDFRRLMETINILSVSTCTAVERNNLAIRIAKFLRKTSKKVANHEIANNVALQQSISDLDMLDGWSGDNLDWAMDKKDVLEELLKASSVKITAEEGVEIDLALQDRLDEAIKKKKSQLGQYFRTVRSGALNGWKKIFNAVFQPALESLMRCIGDNPRYRNYFPEVKLPNMTGVIVRASQSTAKESVASNPEDVMKIFHKMGATGFVSFTINFLQTWKNKVINEICLVDRPGEGFNNPETYVPVSHRLEDGPADPVQAYETDVRHQFVLPTFARLPKMIDEDDDEDDDDDDDEDMFKKMPIAPPEEDLAKHLLMRAEFMLRDPEQGPRHPMWQYVDWLFHQIKIIHQVPEKQAAPLAMRALGFSISRLMKERPNPDKETMEIAASIMQAINFMSARGDPMSHASIDTFFNMGSGYVPQTKDMERSPWQIEVVNILSRAVDYVRPIMSAEEYKQIRSNFQRAAANMVKRQIVQKLLDDLLEEKKKNAESNEEYVARVNNEFYPAYRETVETIGMLLDANPKEFKLTDDLRARIEILYQTIAVDWAPSMRRCRIGPVREMVKALRTFSESGGEAMAYLVSRKPYLTMLYDQVYHIKYEACDHVLVEEVCNIIRAKTRNPEHEKHDKWLARVDRAILDVSSYKARMEGFAHGNKYKDLPSTLMLQILNSLKENPASDNAVTFADVKALLEHVNIDVKEPDDLKVKPNDPDGRKPVLEQLRGAWWMCPDVKVEGKASPEDKSVPSVALIPMGVPTSMPASSNILATLGDTYHKFKLARLFSGSLQPMRSFIRENYKFHLEWFEDTIRAAGLPQYFDPTMVQGNEILAIYAIVQRLVHELVEDGADRGDRARDRVYGEVVDVINDQPNYKQLK